MNVIRVTEFQATKDSVEALYEFLQSLIPYISSSQGCVSCEVLRKVDESDKFVVIEKWHSIDDHKASVENYPKEEMQAAMKLIAAPPSGTYYQS